MKKQQQALENLKRFSIKESMGLVRGGGGPGKGGIPGRTDDGQGVQFHRRVPRMVYC